jgi:hypothetical protein
MHRLGDVLEALRPEVGHLKLKPRLDLPVGVFRQTNPARLANSFEPRSDVHAVPHEVAVALLNDVAEVNAHAILDALFRRQASVALGQAALDFDGATHRVDNAAELDNCAVAGALDDAPVMHGEDRIDQVAPKGPKPGKDAIFVRASKPRVANDVGHQNRSQFPRLAHGANAEVARSPVAVASAWLHFHAALGRRTWKQEVQVLRVGSRRLSTPC